MSCPCLVSVRFVLTVEQLHVAVPLDWLIKIRDNNKNNKNMKFRFTSANSLKYTLQVMGLLVHFLSMLSVNENDINSSVLSLLVFFVVAVLLFFGEEIKTIAKIATTTMAKIPKTYFMSLLYHVITAYAMFSH